MSKQKFLIIRVIVSFLIFIASLFTKNSLYLEISLCVVAYLFVAYDVLLRAAKNISHGEIFDENFLMIIATFGAFITKQYEEAVMVMVLYQLGEWFQSFAVAKSRKSIASLMDIRPEYANLELDGEIKVVDPDDVEVGAIIVVKPGEKIPLDGLIISGEGALDTSSLTGESALRDVKVGDNVLNGCINKTGVLRIEVTKEFEESTVAKILELVENASEKKAQTENFIKKFAKYYTPIVVICALLLALIPPLVIDGATFSDYIQRACAFLVISCPCALVISVPLSFFGGIGGASKLGILIKGSNFVELLAKTNTLVFDKTGTLTKGNFKVTKIVAKTVAEAKLIETAAYGEYYSNHPLAKAVLSLYQGKIAENRIQNIQEISGQGISLLLDGEEVLVGNDKLLQSRKVSFEPVFEAGTIIHVVRNKEYLGYLLIQDEIKMEAKSTIRELEKIGITNTIMLSGDSKKVANYVAGQVGVKEVKSELLPEGKVACLETYLGKNKVVTYVGDGINDAPVLMRADIGISMGSIGSDAAIEASDVVIMDDNINKVPLAIKVAKRIMRIVWQNIILALGIKLIVLILGAFGQASMWLAIFADVGVAFIAILNAMRALYVKKYFKMLTNKNHN